MYKRGKVMPLVSYTNFCKYWEQRDIEEEDMEEWWIDWHNIRDEVGDWDNPQRFQVLNQFVVEEAVCESAFRKL